ncbi:unnamed protein product [Prorocentrum cordatum]|uniref:Uncharacterized protein n=1 Tax=Prorocentrum cordatum TaxID=2364126 RepID=A0ABN9VW99_9DINO|nr:unnamed protein product [Polarella glacialis]
MICELASQKQVEDKAVDEICQVITEKFPNIKFNPDCKTDVEAVWDAAVAKCPQAQLTLPSPADIEKLICELASQKQVEDKAVDEICQVITEKFPNIKFNPDCKTDVEAVWDAAVAKCPQAQLTLPSPVEDKAVDEICQVITEKFPNIKFNPDCKTDVEAVWDAAVAKCPQAQLTLPSPADIEKIICEVASQKQVEDKAVDEICQVITEKFPNIKFNPDCKTDVEAVWDAAVAKCPQAQLTLPSPADIEKIICELASQKQVEDKAVDEICQVITEKFPNIKFNPDCKTDVEAVWDAAVAKCPQAQLTLPSPSDIEKLICEPGGHREAHLRARVAVEDKAVDEICQVITEKFPNIKFNPDCKTTSRPSGTRRWPSARRRS